MLASCFPKNNLAIVHACKTPCHQNKVGYKNNLESSHKNYLFSENEIDLYLNLVDMNFIFSKYTDPIFKSTFDFIEKKRKEAKEILIHCNLGNQEVPRLVFFI